MRALYPFCVALLSLLFGACTLPGDVTQQEDATYLDVTPKEIVFNKNTDNNLIVDCDASWIIVASQDIQLSAREGVAGTTTVTVLDMPQSTTTSLLVKTPSNSKLSAIVKLSRGKEESGDNGDNGDTPTSTPATTLYYDNFDGDPTYSNNWANQSTAWQNPTGDGAGNVTYNASYAKIKNDKYGSASKYHEASGQCYVNISKPGNNPSYFEVRNIATNGEKKFTLSFGAIFKPEHCALYIKCNESEWKRLEYTAAATYNSWAVAEASFSLTNSAEMLSFRFEPISADATYGCNLDDLRLATSKGGQTVDVGASKEFSWAELPKKKVSKSDYVYHTHWSTSVNSKKSVRTTPIVTMCDVTRQCG